MFDISLALSIFFLAGRVTGAESALNSRGEATVASEETVLTMKDVSVADSYAQPWIGVARRQIVAGYLVIAAAAAMALIYTIISCFKFINKRGAKAGIGHMLRRLADEAADQCSVSHLRVVHDDPRSRSDLSAVVICDNMCYMGREDGVSEELGGVGVNRVSLWEKSTRAVGQRHRRQTVTLRGVDAGREDGVSEELGGVGVNRVSLWEKSTRAVGQRHRRQTVTLRGVDA
ncbi:hypothetical protein, conserved, partial [Eimeria necatrix]